MAKIRKELSFETSWVTFGHFLLIYRQEHMSFHLDKESVTAINDGGIGIQHSQGPWTLNGHPRGLKTVVSIEVDTTLSTAKFRLNENL